MGVFIASKTVTPTSITCNGEVDITLSLTASPELTAHPLDIVLLLDRSGSMEDSLPALKTAANSFVDIIRNASPDPDDPNLILNTRIGIVSFSDPATIDLGLSGDVTALHAKINALVAGGRTNHADAFDKGVEVVTPGLNTNKVIILFTDGVSTAPGTNDEATAAATLAATAAKTVATVYAIGLEGNTPGEPLDIDALESWVTPEVADHLAIATDPDDLLRIFNNLATGLINEFAQNIEVIDTINPDFVIIPGSINLNTPTGTTAIANATNSILTWELDKLGDDKTESASVTFKVRHIGATGGPKQVNTSITYQDDDNPVGTIIFPPATLVTVDCGNQYSEPCPTAVPFSASSCTEIVNVELGDIHPTSTGNLLEISLTLKAVCPNRKIALGIYLTKKDPDPSTTFKPYAFRSFTIPAVPPTTGSSCPDIQIDCLKFVLPPDGILTCHSTDLRAYVFVHYIDVGELCCLRTPVN